MSNFIETINQNTFILGVAALISNLGSKQLQTELSEPIQQFLQHSVIRKFILFCFLFMITKNVKISFLITIIFLVCSHGLFCSKKTRDHSSLETSSKSVISSILS